MAGGGLILGVLGAAALAGAVVYISQRDENYGPGIHPDDMKLNDWATANNILVAVPHDRTLSPRTAQPDGAFTVQAIGDTSSGVTLVYFPSTNSLHVNTTGFPIDQSATNSWRAYEARNATATKFKLSSALANATQVNQVGDFPFLRNG